MRTLVIAVSITGYTRRTAEKIREGILSTSTGECELADLADVNPDMLAGYDLVGLGCPVYYYQEPFHVRDFIDALPGLRGQHWFVFCSHGSVMGITLKSMSERLQKRGAVVVGYFDIYADARAPFIPYPTLTTGHPDEEEYQRARAFGSEIVERTRRISAGETGLIPGAEPVNEEWERSAAMFTREVMNFVIPPFHINMDKCNLCRACEDVCPVKGIDVRAEPPRIQEPCTYCTQCVMECPTLAIEADWSLVESTNRDHYARLREWLDEAEKRGEFRWLMDPDSLDIEDTMRKQRERELRAEGKPPKP